MKKFKDYTLTQYLQSLSQKSPTPGGGSAAALTAALGAGLLSMVGNYSLGKGHAAGIEGKIRTAIKDTENITQRLIVLVDLDAQAYMDVVKTKESSVKVKQKALAKARSVPREICRLCYQGIRVAPILAKYGNKYLMGDLEAAVDMLLASFNAAVHFTR